MKKSQISIPPDWFAAQDRLYTPYELNCSLPETGSESEEYGACVFTLQGLRIQFRVGKITPKKIGYFVALWKRGDNGSTQPYDHDDAFDFFIISVKKEENLGQFIFPKSVLLQQGIVSTPQQSGKRGIRLYAPWDNPLSAQAKKTKAWQGQYFLAILPSQPLNPAITARFLDPA